MNDEHGIGITDVSSRISLEQNPPEESGNADDLGAARLGCVIDSKVPLSLRQSGFDCLEVWANHPNRIEPLYAAALLFFENNDVHLALLSAEFAMSIRVKPEMSKRWPLHVEATGWQLELLYARLLVRKGDVSDSMAHYASVLLRCDDAVRRTVRDEVLLASQHLQLCQVSAP